MQKALLIFTNSYPTSYTEEPFLKTELKYLSSSFDKIYIIPQNNKGLLLELPQNVDVDLSLAKLLKGPKKILSLPQTLLKKDFWSELYLNIRNVGHGATALRFMMRSLITKKWLMNFSRKNAISSFVTYSFWADSSCFGAYLARECIPGNVKVVARCHNCDLYKKADNSYYIPFQGKLFRELNLLLPDSQAGYDFIQKEFPQSNCQLGLMAVESPDFLTSFSEDGGFRIVTCSYLVPRKRVELLVEGLKIALKSLSDVHVYWTHIGSGPLENDIQRSVEDMKSPQFQVRFKGNLTPDELREFYKNNPIDVFINTSYAEGTAVSMIEALSCGVPILATTVGGAQEIFDKNGGVALSADPSPREIAEKLIFCLNNIEELRGMRKNALIIYRDLFSPDKNYTEFSQRLMGFLG